MFVKHKSVRRVLVKTDLTRKETYAMSQLHLRCDHVSLGTQLRSYLEDRIENALEKIRDKVNEIHLNIEDINGPNRKGLDKQAKLVVRWKNKQSLVIEDRDSTLGVLVHRLMDRLELAIERRNERKIDKRKNRTNEPS